MGRVLQYTARLVAYLNVVRHPLDIPDFPGVPILDGGCHAVLHHGGVVKLGVGVKYGLQVYIATSDQGDGQIPYPDIPPSSKYLMLMAVP